jgi:hypothetical protein
MVRKGVRAETRDGDEGRTTSIMGENRHIRLELGDKSWRVGS